MAEKIHARKLKAYEFCPRSFALDSLVNETGLPMTAYFARAVYFRSKVEALLKFPEDFLLVKSDALGIDDLLHPEDMPKDIFTIPGSPNPLRFKSPETFASAAVGFWKKHIIGEKGKLHEREIVWNYAGQWGNANTEKPENFREIMEDIHQACINYYNHIIQHGLPVLATRGMTRNFYFRDIECRTTFGEVRKDITLGHHRFPETTQRKLDEDWFVTLQILAYCTLAHQVDAFRDAWKIDQERAESWGGKKMHIDPEVRYFYHRLTTGRKIYTSRTDKDIEKMLEKVQEIKAAIARQEFGPNYSSCRVCKYNVETPLGPACSEKDPKVPTHRLMDYLTSRQKERVD